MLLETQRLQLRTMTPADAPAWFEIMNDFDVVKMTGSWNWPVSLEMVEKRIEKTLSTSPSKLVIPAIIYRGIMIGTVGLGEKEEDAKVGCLGYTIGKKWWGQGFATEIVQAICSYGFEIMKFDVIEADHYDDNPASGRVLEKSGFEKVGALEAIYCKSRGRDLPGWHYLLTRERRST